MSAVFECNFSDSGLS